MPSQWSLARSVRSSLSLRGIANSNSQEKVGRLIPNEEPTCWAADLAKVPEYRQWPFSSLPDQIKEIKDKYGHLTRDQIQKASQNVHVGGRVQRIRSLGSKLTFADLQHDGQMIQIVSDNLNTVKRSDIIGK